MVGAYNSGLQRPGMLGFAAEAVPNFMQVAPLPMFFIFRGCSTSNNLSTTSPAPSVFFGFVFHVKLFSKIICFPVATLRFFC